MTEPSPAGESAGGGPRLKGLLRNPEEDLLSRRVLLPRRPESSSPDSAGPSPHQIRRALGWFSGIASIAAAGFLLAFTLLFLVWGDAFWGGPWKRVSATALLALGASLALRIVSRSPSWSDRRAILLGHAYFVLLCFLGGFFHSNHEVFRYGVVTGLGPYALLIAFLPLILEAGIRETLRTGLLASTASILGVLVVPEYRDAASSQTYLADLLVGAYAPLLFALVVARGQSRLRTALVRARRLGSYHLEEKLGEGGMGEVWRATHRLLARPAAIKIIRPAHLEVGSRRRDMVVERFSREARATAALGSQHTVRLYDFGVAEDGTLFLAMELLDGIDLQTLVRAHGAQPAGRVRNILLQALSSLHEAHELGLVHRDIKPSNLMLCRQGPDVEILKVLDFGLVALSDDEDEDELTRAGAVIGTPAYLAPEVLEHADVDGRTDLYSLGCVAYWLLTGRRVFEHRAPARQMAAHLHDAPLPPSARGVDVPAELEALVLACLAKAPSSRPASAATLRELVLACPSGGWDDGRALSWWSLEADRPEGGAIGRTGPTASEVTDATLPSRRPQVAFRDDPGVASAEDRDHAAE